MVSNLWLLSSKVAGKVLGLNGLSSEPEELLLEDKTPADRSISQPSIGKFEII